MKKYIWIIVALVVLVIIGSVIRSFLARRAANALVNTITGGQVNVANNGAVTYSNDQGSVSTQNKLPDNWPSDAPSYPGATITFAGQSNSTADNPNSGFSVTMTSGDSVDKVTKYYRDNLAQQGWKITDDALINNTTALGASKDNRQFSVSVSTADNQTAIIVGLETSTTN